MYNYDEENKFNPEEEFANTFTRVNDKINELIKEGKVTRRVVAGRRLFPDGKKDIVIADAEYHDIVLCIVVEEKFNTKLQKYSLHVSDCIIGKDQILNLIAGAQLDPKVEMRMRSKDITTWV